VRQEDFVPGEDHHPSHTNFVSEKQAPGGVPRADTDGLAQVAVGYGSSSWMAGRVRSGGSSSRRCCLMSQPATRKGAAEGTTSKLNSVSKERTRPPAALTIAENDDVMVDSG
jgi:hypothetical protein